MNEKKNNINKTVIQNYMYPIDNEDINNKINTISFSNEMLFKEKGNEIKNDINKNSNKKNSILELLKLKLDKLNSYNKINEPKTEREHSIKLKDKKRSSISKICSKSVEKRNRRKKMIINDITKKEKNNFVKLSDIAEKYDIKKSKNKSIYKKISKKTNILRDINNNKKENNNTNEKKEDNIIMIRENYNTLPKVYLTNSEIFDSQINKNNYKIFEVISDVKVKSFIEYEEDKKNLLSKKESNNNISINSDSDKKENSLNNINNNIKEISIIQNEIAKSVDNMNNSEENYTDEKFIEDRDEYNINLKETFSKDRFSFRPTNKDSKETFQENKFTNENNNKNKILDKKDFLNNDLVISSNIKCNDIFPNSNRVKKLNKQVKNTNIKKMKKTKIHGLKNNKK